VVCEGVGGRGKIVLAVFEKSELFMLATLVNPAS
jgi:hypothetical protein